ncbi:MAG: ATP-binding protein [Planctomycetota bacterium]|jgi:signal transduction histidine kinase|nr:ATP-binding protein [Planctomycetota bacterium]
MSSKETSSATGVDPQTLARLAGGLAHELKNPLSTIGLHLALMDEDWHDEEGVKARRTVKTVGILKYEVERLNGILEDFLRFARTDSLETRMGSLNQVVEQVERFASPEADRLGIHMRSHLDLEMPEITLDSGRIRQALLNLVINGRQAMEKRGNGTITLITRHDDTWAVVEVVDDGPGMEEDTLARCFEVYYSTKGSGSGLGLATVRRIVEAHGGLLEVQSAPGKGTRVSMRLPLKSESQDG